MFVPSWLALLEMFMQEASWSRLGRLLRMPTTRSVSISSLNPGYGVEDMRQVAVKETGRHFRTGEAMFGERTGLHNRRHLY